MAIVRLTTWNVNSVRARMDHIRKLVKLARPDVLCLQEIKVDTPDFPLQAFEDMGFSHWAVAGQKGYHGVAVFSRLAIEEGPRHDWNGRGEARHLNVTIGGDIELHNLYVPAGGDVPDPEVNDKFARKLTFFDNMSASFAACQGDGRRRVLLGDLNVAPLDCDVWSHKALLKVVSHTPIEVEKMAALRDSLDWVDAMRHFHAPPAPLFTWWSYRARDWRANNRGRRLDHIWVTPELAPALRGLILHEETRDWPRPSDHIPVSLDLAMDPA